MGGTVSLIRQTFPPKPIFKENDIPDLQNKVIIVTGANTGVGKEVARLVYSKGATVYLMARSEEKTLQAIKDIKAAVPTSTGRLNFIQLDLADLEAVKTSADVFLRKERQLHVLFNNAGVGYPEKGSQTKQGYELQLGVNCVGAFSLTKYLTPTLVSTAKTSAPNTVRVVWVSSSAAEAVSPKGFIQSLSNIKNQNGFTQYCTSKLGNYLHATEFAERHRSYGIISVSLNPGNLDSDFWRTQGPLMTWVLRKTVLYPSIYGAYTVAFAGFSQTVNMDKSGTHIAPWGRLWEVSKEMFDAARSRTSGGTGVARDFWVWSETQVSPYHR